MVNVLMIRVKDGIHTYTYSMLPSAIVNGVTCQETINGDGEPFKFGKVVSAKLTFQFNTDLFDINKVANSFQIIWMCKMMNEQELVFKDIFYLEGIELNGNIATVTAYNVINQLEVSAYDFLKNNIITSGYTITNFVTNLINWWKTTYNIKSGIEVSMANIATVKRGQKVYPNLINLDNIQDITVRQLLQYCAELLGAFVICRGNQATNASVITFKDLDFSYTVVDNTMYVSQNLSFQQIPRCNTFVWGSADNTGYVYVRYNLADGTYAEYEIFDNRVREIIINDSTGYLKRQIYYLEANPLVDYSVAKRTEYTPAAIALPILNSYNYYKGEVVLLNDFGLDTGDAISINGKVIYIMEKTISPTGVVFRSTGAMDRNFQEEREGRIIITYKQQS